MRGAMRSFVMGLTTTLCAISGTARAGGGVGCYEGFPALGIPGFPNGEVRAIAAFDDGSGPTLYIAGTFEEVDGQTARSRMARSANNTFAPFGESSSLSPSVSWINTLTTGPLPNGNGQALYVGGRFMDIGGIVTTNSLAAYTDLAEWWPIPGSLDGLTGEGVKSIAVIGTSGPTGMLMVVHGSFNGASGSPASGIAQWTGDGNLSPIPLPSTDYLLGMIYGVATIDLDGPDGPATPVIAIHGAARTFPPEISTSAIRIYDGVSASDLGPLPGSPNALRGTARALTAGDPDGDGPLPWTIFAAGSNLLGGGELLAYYDAANDKWYGLNAPYTGEGSLPTFLDSIAAVQTDEAEHMLLVTACSFASGKLLHYIPSAELFYNAQDLPESIRVIRNLPEVVPSGTPAVFVGGDFSAPVQPFDSVANYAPYGAENIAQTPIYSVNRAIFPAQANTEASPPLPYAEFSAETPFNALGSFDADGAGPELAKLVAQIRYDPKSGGTLRIGSEPITSEVATWDGSRWSVIPGFFDDFGSVPDIRVIVEHDFDGAGPENPSLIVAGDFRTIDSNFIRSVARYDGFQWHAMNSSGNPMGPHIYDAVSGEVGNLFPGEKSLIIGGELTDSGFSGGTPMSGVAVWVGSSEQWWFLDSINLGTDPVRALAIYDADGPGSGQAPVLYAASSSRTLFWDGGGPVSGPVIGGVWSPITPGLGNGTQDMIVYDFDGDGGVDPRLAFIGRFPGIPDGAGDDSRVVIYDGVTGTRTALNGFPWFQALSAQVLVSPSGSRRLAVAGYDPVPDKSQTYEAGVAISDGSPEPGWQIIATADSPNDFPMVAIDDDGDGPNPNSLVIASSGLFDVNFGVLPRVSVQHIARFEPAVPGLWANDGGGTIDNPVNYNCNLVPFGPDFLRFDNTPDSPGLDSRIVALPSDYVLGGILALNDDNMIDLNGYRLDMAPPGGPGSRSPAIVVGDGPVGTTRLGFVSTSAFGFAMAAIDKVEVARRATGSDITQELFVGGNVQLSVSDADIGIAGRGGRLVIDASDSSDNAVMSVSSTLRVGIEPGSLGTISILGDPGVSQAVLNPYGAGPCEMGVAGYGSLTVTSGGRFIGAFTETVLGVETGSTGAMSFVGSNVLGILSSPNFILGRNGYGSLNVQTFASVVFDSGNIVLGEQPGSRGTITVRDSGVFTHNDGSLTVGLGGTGVLQVFSSGVFTSSAGLVNITPNGILVGSGEINAEAPSAPGLVNSGIISPSSAPGPGGGDLPGSVGNLYISGPFTQDRAGNTLIDISVAPGGTITHDNIVLTGNVNLAGRLDVRLAPGSILPPGALSGGIEIVYSEHDITGSFDVATFPGLPPDIISGRGRFLRFAVGPIPGRGAPHSVMVIEDTLESIIESASPSEYDIGGAGTAAALGDLDNDGDRDLVITIPDSTDPVNNPGSIIILYNAGNLGGYWQGFSSTTQILVGRNPSGVALGDFDDTNGLDIAVIHGSDNDLIVLTNNGSGGFSPGGPARGTKPIPVGEGPNAIDARDLNGDGRTDAVVSVGGASALRVFYNAGGTGEDWGGFGASETIAIAGSPAGTTTVDLDDDKFDDVSTPQPSAGTISNNGNRGNLLRGSADQFGEPVVIFVGGEPVDIAAGDLNLDGFQDLVVAIRSNGAQRGDVLASIPPSGALAIILGDGTIQMTPPTYIAAGDGPTSVALARLDGDNDLDIAVVTSNELGERVVRIIRNDLFGGELNFAFQTDLYPGSAPTLVLSGDVTGDQSDDLVTVNNGGIVDLRGDTGRRDVSVFTFASCYGDANNDRIVGMDDIATILANWQNVYTPSTGPGDANGNGVVEFSDITAALAFYGRTCN